MNGEDIKDKFKETVQALDSDELLTAVQMAYRKHHMGDESIGWTELSDILHNALFDAMGPNELERWKDKVEG